MLIPLDMVLILFCLPRHIILQSPFLPTHMQLLLVAILEPRLGYWLPTHHRRVDVQDAL